MQDKAERNFVCLLCHLHDKYGSAFEMVELKWRPNPESDMWNVILGWKLNPCLWKLKRLKSVVLKVQTRKLDGIFTVSLKFKAIILIRCRISCIKIIFIMITSRKQLKFYLQADMMMNRGYFKVPLKKRFIQLFSPDYIMEFLKSMRKVQYYTYRGGDTTYYQ